MTCARRWNICILAQIAPLLVNRSFSYTETPSSTEAMEQAAAMVDRFNRQYLRTLRALRDLRRCVSAVTIQQAGQVNVGGQQSR